MADEKSRGPPSHANGVAAALQGQTPPYGVAYRSGEGVVAGDAVDIRHRGRTTAELHWPDGTYTTVDTREALVGLHDARGGGQ